ncbi:MAG: DUF885 domain-containing protein [Rudaea sp.]
MTPSRQFDRLATEYFEASYRASPTTATDLGIHKYDDRLDDLSAGALRAHAAELKRFRTRLDRIDSRSLELGAQIDRTLILSEIDADLLSLETICDWQRDPSFYVSSPLFSIFMLASREFAPLRERVRCMAARLEQLPDLLAAGRKNLDHPPRVLTEIAIEETEGALEFCSALVPQIQERLGRRPRALERAAAKAARALADYLGFLKHDLLLVSTGRPGIGAQHFQERLNREHLLPYSVDEVTDMGQRVLEETRRELVEWAKRIDPERTWLEIAEGARRRYPTAARLLPAYRREVERLRRFVEEQELVTLPEQGCEVVETPAFDRALNNYAAYVGPAPFDRDQQGQFWVTPVDKSAPQSAQVEQLMEHSNYLYPITAAHEAYPGHHVQLVRANEVGSRWRKHFSSSLFAEGWALYSEELMARAGYYKDLETRLFQLKDRLWRAARVIIEIGIHCYEMPVSEGARFLVDRVGMTPTAARAETRRYAAEPTQPLSYLIGELEVFRLRDKFSMLSRREFHDMLLSSGTIPFALVEKEMEQKTR